MKEEFYPEVIATDLLEGYIGDEERYVYQYPIIMKYLKKKIDNRCVADYINSVGAERIVIYAATKFAELLIKDIRNDSTDMIWAVCDKNSKKLEKKFHQCRVIGIDEMISGYKQKRFDKIIVCSVFYANAIIDELIKNDIEYDDILTATQVVYWM